MLLVPEDLDASSSIVTHRRQKAVHDGRGFRHCFGHFGIVLEQLRLYSVYVSIFNGSTLTVELLRVNLQ